MSSRKSKWILIVAHEGRAEILCTLLSEEPVRDPQKTWWVKYVRRSQQPRIQKWNLDQKDSWLPDDLTLVTCEELGKCQRTAASMGAVIAIAEPSGKYAGYELLPDVSWDAPGIRGRLAKVQRALPGWFERWRPLLLVPVALLVFALIGGPTQVEQLHALATNQEVKTEATFDLKVIELCPRKAPKRRFTVAPTLTMVNQGWSRLEIEKNAMEVTIHKDPFPGDAWLGSFAGPIEGGLWKKQFDIYPGAKEHDPTTIRDPKPEEGDRSRYAHGEKFMATRHWVLELPEDLFKNDQIVTVDAVSLTRWCECRPRYWVWGTQTCERCSSGPPKESRTPEEWTPRDWQNRTTLVLDPDGGCKPKDADPTKMELSGTLTVVKPSDADAAHHGATTP